MGVKSVGLGCTAEIIQSVNKVSSSYVYYYYNINIWHFLLGKNYCLKSDELRRPSKFIYKLKCNF